MAANMAPSAAPWYLLFEVAALLLIHEHQVQVVPHRELLVDVAHRRRQLVATQEQPDGD